MPWPTRQSPDSPRRRNHAVLIPPSLRAGHKERLFLCPRDSCSIRIFRRVARKPDLARPDKVPLLQQRKSSPGKRTSGHIRKSFSMVRLSAFCRQGRSRQYTLKRAGLSGRMGRSSGIRNEKWHLQHENNAVPILSIKGRQHQDRIVGHEEVFRMTGMAI